MATTGEKTFWSLAYADRSARFASVGRVRTLPASYIRTGPDRFRELFFEIPHRTFFPPTKKEGNKKSVFKKELNLIERELVFLKVCKNFSPR